MTDVAEKFAQLVDMLCCQKDHKIHRCSIDARWERVMNIHLSEFVPNFLEAAQNFYVYFFDCRKS